MTLPALTPWPSEALWQAVEPQLPGFSVEVLPEIDSTNAELMRRLRAGVEDPVLLIAEHQTAGRGRMARPWHSSPGAAGSAGPGTLMLSLGLPLAPKDWSGLSLAVGWSLANSLHPEIRLKWPNDLWWQGRKLAGILIETANTRQAALSGSRYVVIGIGLNIQRPEVAGLSTEPAGLAELVPGISAMLALTQILPPLVQTLRAFEQQGFAAFQARFNARDALAQTPVTLSDGQHGVAMGVDPVGALLLQTGQGLQRVTSAEVSVRRAAAPANPASGH
ncbi:biotin--[acetyl-CoA-carboxylase] ligase [Rhodoferax fermentans]|uniref:biotin--[biotin carboxyl-carrier protein] ligase n=1 Tax=Rhodoferax fermentans TaxID=28066 RepID=A0A1T1ASE2_RHOFE|nr:biotin--[acetyl-CoA-carboxylase] ligase [Rhodoferax fermentans]MBK1684134.1 biotin--[acetyl-CoA-carboxylase] ligase [Rhodoferax fermentans]OOV07010.1 biotin--[acetyl-CoA-carboxylase] ligase [Rhodoferax fermentans]